MSEGYCKIDPEAARADISRITQSIELLQQAYQTLSQLIAQAESMQGRTPLAISNKARELQDRIKMLNESLGSANNDIKSAVIEYQEKDSEAASYINRGGY